MAMPHIRKTLAVFLGGVFLGAITLAGSTWVLLLRADGYPTNATLQSIDQGLWRSVHNTSAGTEWIALSDWGQGLVNEGPGLIEVPEWARPRIKRSPGGIQRVGTLRAGWPLPWVGAWWSSNRRDENWPPAPFDEDLGHGLGDATERFLARQDNPTYFFQWTGFVIDLVVLSLPWWVVLGLAAWRGAPLRWGYPDQGASAG